MNDYPCVCVLRKNLHIAQPWQKLCLPPLGGGELPRPVTVCRVSFCLFLLLSVSVRTAHSLLVGLLCLFIRSEGLQVAERTRLITSFETRREGVIDREMGKWVGQQENYKEERGNWDGRKTEQEPTWTKKGKERRVETRGSNYLHMHLCCAHWCMYWVDGERRSSVIR